MKKQKHRLRPYKNWTKEELETTLLKHVNRLDIQPMLREAWKDVIREAFISPYWDVIEDYNGCTLVQDMFHPCPACFVHDYMWIAGYGGVLSDKIFKGLMLAEGMKKGKANLRWFGVRVGWIFYFYWLNLIKRKLKKPTNLMYELYRVLR